ncbi:Putative 5-azacytidine resistance protein azr1 [[Torrubiella] hemipterigena]|uniref:Protein phosphatase n=1 Tax=[Torrubiella] hemipterigena TaxID=1531966 RepID=A0A0A1T5R5_9HYPO|nr:Putative 5-azacytidine resistance protein azr1 [[Torrubiella] hemipterigena]
MVEIVILGREGDSLFVDSRKKKGIRGLIKQPVLSLLYSIDTEHSEDPFLVPIPDTKRSKKKKEPFAPSNCTYMATSSRRLVASTPWFTAITGALAMRPQQNSYSTTTTTSTSSPKFSYNIAASFIAKDRPYDPSTHVFHFNPYNRIQPPRNRKRSSRPDSGHDAFFVSRVNDSGAVAFGVADGVGGWVDSGVDPADFSHGFCDYMAAAAYEHKGSTALTARSLMQAGYDAVCNDKSLSAGGSTACVAVASPDGVLDVANLGDSGFIQMRLNAVNTYSEPQTHAFNTPYQLSIVPPSVAARMAAFGGTQLSDLPRDADVTHHNLRHGDILMFATDGVFDNLFHHDILRIVSRVMTSAKAWEVAKSGSVNVGSNLETIVKSPLETKLSHSVTLQSLLATELVLAAKRASVNTKMDGPFAKEVQKYYPHENWHGGKVDDICVVVAVVCEEPAAAASAPLKSKL